MSDADEILKILISINFKNNNREREYYNMSSLNGNIKFYYDENEDNEDALKLKLKMFCKRKQKERLSIFQNELNSGEFVTATQNEILKRFNLTQQKKTPNIRFDVTLKPNLSIRGDKIRATKLEEEEEEEEEEEFNIGHCYNTSTTSRENKKPNNDKTYFSLPLHVRSRNRDNHHQTSVARHTSDLARVHSPFTYIETYSIKRRCSLSPKSLIKKARI